MISSFDLDKLKPLFQDFYTLTGIHISLFSERYEEIFPYPEELPSFCQLIRTDAEATIHCKNCDRESCRIAARQHNVYFYQCHAGLTEACTPIYMGEVIAGYIIVGNIFAYPDHETGWQTIRKLCMDYNIDQAALQAACLERPILSRQYVLAACHILEAVASYLCNERVAILKKGNLHTRIDEYILQHLTDDLSVATLCQQFSIGKTYLYEITSSTYGIGVAEHIRSLRMEHARKLLKDSPELSVSDVASACGFKDYNYFISAFRKNTGCSPKQYQKNG
ncbi:MAG: PocR ligand-binding domain-containing protein [Lachnospiraceae bacterium]|nr:PocR ligand-binding domain-containing protein [Lachnospiraceae bacterium]